MPILRREKEIPLKIYQLIYTYFLQWSLKFGDQKHVTTRCNRGGIFSQFDYKSYCPNLNQCTETLDVTRYSIIMNKTKRLWLHYQRFTHLDLTWAGGTQVYLVTNFRLLLPLLFPSVYCQSHMLCRDRNALWYKMFIYNYAYVCHCFVQSCKCAWLLWCRLVCVGFERLPWHTAHLLLRQLNRGWKSASKLTLDNVVLSKKQTGERNRKARQARMHAIK